jgi:hypothetical protein
MRKERPSIDVERATRLLSQYKGPKLGTQLAHEFKRDIHALIEKAYILRALDQGFERQLERLGVLEVMDRFLREEVDRHQRERRRPGHHTNESDDDSSR